MASSKSEKQKLDRESLEKVAEIFKVFSEATRLAILQELKEGAKSVNELVEAVASSQANVSKQLKTLFDAGIVERSKSGTQVFYSVSEEIVYPLCELVCGKLNRERREVVRREVVYEI